MKYPLVFLMSLLTMGWVTATSGQTNLPPIREISSDEITRFLANPSDDKISGYLELFRKGDSYVALYVDGYGKDQTATYDFLYLRRAKVQAKDVERLVAAALTWDIQEVWINLCVVLGDLNFFRTKFEKRMTFVGTTFEGKVDFRFATFSEDAVFNAATFSDTVTFEFATFLKIAMFRGVTFSQGANFEDVTFSGAAEFHYATFSGEVEFHETTFSKAVDFDVATFSGPVHFSRCQFEKLVDFRGCLYPIDIKIRFSGTTGFDQLVNEWEYDAQFDLGTNQDKTRRGLKGKFEYDETFYAALIQNYSGMGWFAQADDAYYTHRVERRKRRPDRLFALVERVFLEIPFGYGVKPFMLARSFLCLWIPFGWFYVFFLRHQEKGTSPWRIAPFTRHEFLGFVWALLHSFSILAPGLNLDSFTAPYLRKSPYRFDTESEWVFWISVVQRVLGWYLLVLLLILFGKIWIR